MKYLLEFLNQYGMSLIHSILLGIVSYISLEIKKIYKKYVNDRTKKEVVKVTCQAINQLYPNLNGNEKLEKAIVNSKEILNEKGIVINDLELRMYIEATVNSFKQMFGGDNSECK